MLKRMLVFLLAMVSPVRGQASPEQVEQAIQRGKAFLYSRQAADGSWENSPRPDPDAKPHLHTGGQWGGTTALAAYALLSVGDSHTEPKLAKAIEFLRKAELIGVYAVSLRVQVWSMLPQTPEVKQFIREDVKRLLATLKTEGAARGFHDYIPGGGNSYSHSRANYAVLGLWTAAQCVEEVVPESYWKLAAEAWMRHQDPSGGWRYKAPGDPYQQDVTPGMTAAGVATLFIAQDFLFPEGNTRPTPLKQSLDRGLAWLGSNFGKVASDERFDRDFPYITLYAVERVALASGLRYFGDQDWYDKIASWVVSRQRPAGGWHRENTGAGSIADTSFALITLARGRAPIAFSKLDYSAGTGNVDWNVRPRDIANVTRYIARQMERELNWQIVRLDSPLRDWHDAAVLYLAGGKPLPLNPQDKSKLRDYIESGGLVLCAADASSRAFGDSVRKLGLELFPGREWRELPAEHPIYTAGQFPRTAWRSKPQVLALSNGVRELMILLPVGDPGRWWQSNNTGSREEIWQLATNIQQYAAGRERQRLRGQSPVVEKNPRRQPERTIRLARLQYTGNWDPEPGGWRRLAAILHNHDKVNLEIHPVELGQPIEASPLAHWTGTDAVRLDTAAGEAIKAFIASGGTLLIDAAGGASAFSATAETALSEIFPGVALEALPEEHPMLSAGGKPVPIAYRPFARTVVGTPGNRSRLLCLQINGRPAVIFSREDLSAGLLGTNTDGVIGYAPATATELVRRLVLSCRTSQ